MNSSVTNVASGAFAVSIRGRLCGGGGRGEGGCGRGSRGRRDEGGEGREFCEEGVGEERKGGASRK